MRRLLLIACLATALILAWTGGRPPSDPARAALLALTPQLSLPVVYQGYGGNTPTPTATPLATATFTPVPGATATNTPVATATSTTGPVTAMARLNALRAMANLPPVTENASWSDGGRKHAMYMVKNNYIGHDEDPANPFYTPEGQAAAQNGNAATSSGSTNTSDASFINRWAVGPFHMIGIIDPKLTQSGFGSYRESKPGFTEGATLDVIRGINNAVAPSYPIYWPANGKTVDLIQYSGNESPDPLTSCAGYGAPSGLPIYLQLGSGANTTVTASSFQQAGLTLPHCVFTGSTYTNPNAGFQSLGRNILTGRGAIVLIAKDPLVRGATYSVSLTVNGTPYAWSFTVANDAVIESGG